MVSLRLRRGEIVIQWVLCKELVADQIVNS
jgi:hypothetical protein